MPVFNLHTRTGIHSSHVTIVQISKTHTNPRPALTPDTDKSIQWNIYICVDTKNGKKSSHCIGVCDQFNLHILCRFMFVAILKRVEECIFPSCCYYVYVLRKLNGRTAFVEIVQTLYTISWGTAVHLWRLSNMCPTWYMGLPKYTPLY